jgi:hypothetical protein
MIGVVAYALLLAPNANERRLSSLVSADTASQLSYLDEQLLSDLNLTGIRAGLEAMSGSYYDFDVSSLEDGGGANELIAKRLETGHFQLVWQGQDIPPCAPIDQFDVPAGLVPYCVEEVVIDRSNSIRALYTKLFNPHVNAKGEIIF